jgi:hypothetical protein
MFRCICVMKQNLIYLQNREASNIIIDCSVCGKKKQIGPNEVHQVLKENFKTTITTKEFDKV